MLVVQLAEAPEYMTPQHRDIAMVRLQPKAGGIPAASPPARIAA
jgi:hypothetical protein